MSRSRYYPGKRHGPPWTPGRSRVRIYGSKRMKTRTVPTQVLLSDPPLSVSLVVAGFAMIPGDQIKRDGVWYVLGQDGLLWKDSGPKWEKKTHATVTQGLGKVCSK